MKKVVLMLLLAAVVLMVAILISCAPASPSEQPTEPPTAPSNDAGERYEKAPDFETIDSQGKSIKLSDYVGKKNLVIVINRGFG